jgi:hypothetical protein
MEWRSPRDGTRRADDAEPAVERVVIGDAMVMRGGVYGTGGPMLNHGHHDPAVR